MTALQGHRRPAVWAILAITLIALLGGLATGTAQADPDPGSGKLVLVLDSSGSMKEPAGDGQTKIVAARAALTKVVTKLPAEAEIGLRVYGRLVTSFSARWLPMATVTALVLAVQGVAISLLPVAGRQVVGAVVCLTLFGLGFGVSSIATPAILLDRYGADGFGTTSGILTTPVTIAKAGGPLGGAALAETFGYRPLILTVAAACVTAAIALALTRRMPPKLTLELRM